MKLYYKTSILVSLLILGCVKDENSSYFEDVPVIEGYLLANDIINLKISRQVPFLEGVEYSNEDINSLNIKVSNNNNIYSLSPIGDGRYVDSTLTIEDGKKYDLNFIFNDKEVTASTTIPDKPLNLTQSVSEMIIRRVNPLNGLGAGFGDLPDPVEISWSNPDSSNYIVVVENIEENPEPILIGDQPPPVLFLNRPTQGSTYEIPFGSFSYYGTHRIILYHINPDYALLYEDQETSSQNFSTPISGINNGFGIFTGMSSDELLLEIKAE